MPTVPTAPFYTDEDYTAVPVNSVNFGDYLASVTAYVTKTGWGFNTTAIPYTYGRIDSYVSREGDAYWASANTSLLSYTASGLAAIYTYDQFTDQTETTFPKIVDQSGTNTKIQYSSGQYYKPQESSSCEAVAEIYNWYDNGAGSWTIEGFVELEQFADFSSGVSQYVIAAHGEEFVNTQGRFALVMNSGTLEAWYDDDGTTRVAQFANFTRWNTLTHIAAVMTGAVLKLYVNGELGGVTASITSGGAFGEQDRSGVFNLGGGSFPGFPTASMRGYFYEYRFSQMARYTAAFTPPERFSRPAEGVTGKLLSTGNALVSDLVGIESQWWFTGLPMDYQTEYDGTNTYPWMGLKPGGTLGFYNGAVLQFGGQWQDPERIYGIGYIPQIPLVGEFRPPMPGGPLEFIAHPDPTYNPSQVVLRFLWNDVDPSGFGQSAPALPYTERPVLELRRDNLWINKTPQELYDTLVPVQGAYSRVTTVAMTGHALEVADVGSLIVFTNIGVSTLFIPPYVTLDIPLGSIVTICQLGAGKVTVVGGAAVSVLSPRKKQTRTRYSIIRAQRVDFNVWVLDGDLDP